MPGAVAIGGVGGGIIGAAHAADEGQQVDTLNSLKKDRRKNQSFSAYIEDVALMALPAEARKTVEKLVTAKKSTQFVQYGMTVRELLTKADPFNLKNARAHVRALSAKTCMDDVQKRLGDKFILLLNDRIIDGHHFLAKAERAQATNALMVLDLTPARFQLEAAGEEPGIRRGSAASKQLRAICSRIGRRHRSQLDGGGLSRRSAGEEAQARIHRSRYDGSAPRIWPSASLPPNRLLPQLPELSLPAFTSSARASSSSASFARETGCFESWKRFRLRSNFAARMTMNHPSRAV